MPLSGILSPAISRPTVPPSSRVNEVSTRVAGVLSEITSQAPDALVLERLESARIGWEVGQELKLWTAQICGGLAVGLFPYTPGMIENCKTSHNAGWLCGARICTFVAATGATLIGAMVGVSYWKNRTWLQNFSNEMAQALSGSSVSSKMMTQDALTDYLKLSRNDRRAVRDACRRQQPQP